MSLHRKQQQTKLPLARLAGSPHIRRMIDPFGRAITYLRVSVTDRCDFRCAYCMTDTMSFLPREELLSLEELDRLVSAFVGLGVRKLRLTGGEPLVRRNLMWLVERLGRHIESGALEELTLTTNGSQLARHAATLRSAGIERINVSLDTLDPTKFAEITRGGRLSQVLGGIDAARSAGLAIKINTVVLKGVNEHEITHLVAWCGQQEFDLALIEVMPMGEVEAEMRTDQYVPLSLIRARLEADWTLRDTDYRTGGPARYVTVEETGRRLGFITPLTHNFCDACNRVRLTCTGKLFMCLGQEDAADFRPILRAHALDDRREQMALEEAILNAIGRKPRGHDFVMDRVLKTPAIGRAMSVTGG